MPGFRFGFGTGLGSTSTGGGGAAPAIQPVQVVTAPNFMATGLSSAVSTFVRWEVRRPVYIGIGGASQLIGSYSNDTVIGAAGNAITIASVALEKNGGISVPVTFNSGANRNKVLAIGDKDIQADPVLPSAFGLSQFSAGELYWERIVYEFASGTDTYPLVMALRSFTGMACYKMATGVAASADGTGPLVATSKTAVSSGKIFCGVWLGKPVTAGSKAFGCVGDSFTRDNDVETAAGNYPLRLFADVFERAMLDQFATPSSISPFINFGVYGTGITGYTGATDRRKTYYKYCTDFYDEYGANDSVTATAQTAFAALWAVYKAESPNCRIWRTLLIDKDATSTDGFITEVNQTLSSRGVPGGFFPVMNTWFATKFADGTLTGLIPLGRARAQSDFMKWRASLDGVTNWVFGNNHPTNNAGVPCMASEARSIMIPNPSAAPGQVGSFAALASNTTITATWTEASNSPSDHLVEISSDGGSNYTPLHTYEPTLAHCWTGLTPSTSYKIRVTPINHKGAGTVSSVVTISTAAAPSGLVVDGLSSAPNRAISSRRLRSAYTGQAFFVRRSYDNLETPVYFNATGELDTVWLLAWANGGSVIVKRAYDQSAAAAHVTADYTSGSTATWPFIVEAGVLRAVSGKAAVYFDGGRYFSFSSLSGVPASNIRTAVVAVHFPVQPANHCTIVGSGATGGFQLLASTADQASLNKAGAVGILTSTPTIGRNPAVISVTYDGTVATLYKNGTSIGTASNAQTFSGGGQCGLGTSLPAGQYPTVGYLEETVQWDAVPSVGDRQAVENSARTYWGTA